MERGKLGFVEFNTKHCSNLLSELKVDSNHLLSARVSPAFSLALPKFLLLQILPVSLPVFSSCLPIELTKWKR